MNETMYTHIENFDKMFSREQKNNNDKFSRFE